MRQWKRSGPLALALGCVAVLTFSGAGFTQAQSPREAEKGLDQTAKLIALEKKFNEQMAAFAQAYTAAETEEDGHKIIAEMDRLPGEFAQAFLAIAQEDSATEAAFDAAVRVVTPPEQTPAGGPAFKILMKHHADREELVHTCRALAISQSDDAQTLLEYLAEKSPHRNVRATATFSLAHNIMYRDSGDQAQQGRAEKLFELVVGEYGDVEFRGRPLAQVANSCLFEIRNLSIGKVAPEIAGQDVDGVDFKLTDYRGKVVVIDFWGDW